MDVWAYCSSSASPSFGRDCFVERREIFLDHVFCRYGRGAVIFVLLNASVVHAGGVKAPFRIVVINEVNNGDTSSGTADHDDVRASLAHAR